MFSSATLANQAVSPSLTCAYLGSAAKILGVLGLPLMPRVVHQTLDPSGMKLSLRFSLFPANISGAFLESSAISLGSLLW